MGLDARTHSNLVPFYIHVCINGREWLARRMERDGLRYVRQDKCFPWVEDPQRAQRLLNQQLEVNWSERLQPIAERLNPLPWGDLSEFRGAVLLELFPMRM